MDAREFLGLLPGEGPDRWQLPIVKGLTTRGGFLFGGVALGAALYALEQSSGRAAVWASAQYLSYAQPGETLTIDVETFVAGHQVTQAQAVCRADGRTILTVNAALGHRPMEVEGQWERMPEVPGPAECPPRLRPDGGDGHIDSFLDQRLVKARAWDELTGERGDGQAIMWSRIVPLGTQFDAAGLAILGDFVPMGVGQALGTLTSGNSLDNSLRICRLVPTEWVLLDIRVHAVARGFGHGLVHMFAEDGTLLATASQSCIVRNWNTSNVGSRPSRGLTPKETS
jgi:acyl-CoA thioesterase-2